MSEQERGIDQDMQEEVLNDEGHEMDEAFQHGDCVEVKFDSDEDVPLDSDGEDDENLPADKEEGIIDEREIYGDMHGDMAPGVDDAMAHVCHGDSVLSVALSPTDRRILLTGGQDDVAVLWSIEEGQGGGLKCVERHRLTGHTDSVSQVAFSNDGKYAATGAYDGTVRIWMPETGELIHTLEGPSKEIEWILWHPKGHAILAGSADTMAWMWWAPTGKLMQIFAGHGQSVTCGAWGLGGKLIITGSADRSVIVWNPRGGTPQQHAREVHENAIVSMCSHPEAPLVVTGSEDSSARVIQIETGKVVANLPGHTSSVEAVGFSNSGSSGMFLLATASMDGKIQIWDGKTFDLRSTIKDHVEEAGIVRFKWLPSSTYASWLCTCATDGTVRVFNALSAACMHTLRGHSDTVLDLDVALGEVAGGPQLAVVSGSDDKTCRVFTVTLGASAAASAAPVVAPAPAPAAAPAADLSPGGLA